MTLTAVKGSSLLGSLWCSRSEPPTLTTSGQMEEIESIKQTHFQSQRFDYCVSSVFFEDLYYCVIS